jgi:hypothetical protein
MSPHPLIEPLGSIFQCRFPSKQLSRLFQLLFGWKGGFKLFKGFWISLTDKAFKPNYDIFL